MSFTPLKVLLSTPCAPIPISLCFLPLRAAPWSSLTQPCRSCLPASLSLHLPATLKFNSEHSSLNTTASPSKGLCKDDISLLHNPQLRILSLYFLHKLYKPGFPGRSIVASFSSPPECVSVYIDTHLQPIVKYLPNIFLQIIRSLPMPLPSNIIMVTVDVTFLYTNIPPLPWSLCPATYP